MDGGKIVTLVGALLANKGEEYIFLGAAEKCDTCRLKNSCTNLEIGRRYRIEHVREEIKHDCSIHEDGVRVVEVTEPPIKVVIDAKRALKGSKIVFEPAADCADNDAALADLCHPAGLKVGDRCTILNVIDEGEYKGLKVVEVKREG